MVASEEAEKISLKNGLLFNELLSAFGHLDTVTSTIRSISQNIALRDAYIRFERATEMYPKSHVDVENVIQILFIEPLFILVKFIY